jgi:SAM-dependent methyltransferase
MIELKHRSDGYKFLKGYGLDIGALYNPIPLLPGCQIEYCDVVTKEQALKAFPELDIDDLVDIQYICDLNKDGLTIFEDNKFDFVILSHVIEHVANPIYVISELFRITRPGGCVLIAAPDKNYTFDRDRALTPNAHLVEEYKENVTEITDVHYVDYLRSVRPEVFDLSEQDFEKALQHARSRREHIHVWDSEAFREFLIMSLDLLKINSTCLFESIGKENHAEYFSVWRKQPEAQSVPRTYKGREHGSLFKWIKAFLKKCC